MRGENDAGLTWRSTDGTLAGRTMASQTQILIAEEHPSACFKIVGRGDFRCSDDLRQAIRRLRETGYTEFTFDLADCPHLDSTFIGVLASPLRKLTGPAGSVPAGRVRISRAQETVCQILEDMGIAPMVEMVDTAPDSGSFHPSEAHNASRAELSEASLEAHETLMALDPERNAARFQDVVTFLRKELGKGPASGA